MAQLRLRGAPSPSGGAGITLRSPQLCTGVCEPGSRNGTRPTEHGDAAIWSALLGSTVLAGRVDADPMSRLERDPAEIWTTRQHRRGSCRSSYLRLRQLQPEAHIHLAVQRDRGSEVLARLPLLAGAPTDLAEAEMAVAAQWTHTERLRCGQGLVIVGLGALVVRAINMRGDLAEQTEAPCLVSPFLVLAGEREGTPTEVDGLISSSRQEIRFALEGQRDRMEPGAFDRRRPFHTLLEKWQSVGRACR